MTLWVDVAATLSRPIPLSFCLLSVYPHVHQVSFCLCTNFFTSRSFVHSVHLSIRRKARSFSIVEFLGTVTRHVAHFSTFVTLDLRIRAISGDMPLVVTSVPKKMIFILIRISSIGVWLFGGVWCVRARLPRCVTHDRRKGRQPENKNDTTVVE